MASIRPRLLSRLVAAVALGMSSLLVSLALAGEASAAPVTTSSILAAAKKAIAKRVGVHLALSVKTSATATSAQVSADLGRRSGLEAISEGGASVMIKATPSYDYFTGNAAGLTKIFGLSSANARKVGKKWVSLKAGTSEYSSLQSGATISSVTGVLPKAKGTTLTSEILGGVRYYLLRWKVAATGSAPALSYSLTMSSRALPMRETALGAGGSSETISLSHWDEHVVVHPPAAASTVAYTTISG